MNVELLKKIRDHILEEPRRLVMSDWVLKKGELRNNIYGHHEFPECGTAACIGGWALVLSGQPLEIRDPNDMSNTIDRRAAKVLEIAGYRDDLLFVESYWPEQFRSPNRLNADDGTIESAKRTAARIDYFIENGL